MIKAPMVKNVFNHSSGLFGLQPVQLIFAGIAVVVGILTTLWLLQYNMSIDVIGWVVFAEMAVIIGFGAVRINGMNVFSFLIKGMKKDQRAFSRKGVFDDEEE